MGQLWRDDRHLKAQLASVIASLCCLAEHAAGQGDERSAQILLNAADLLEVGVIDRLDGSTPPHPGLAAGPSAEAAPWDCLSPHMIPGARPVVP